MVGLPRRSRPKPRTKVLVRGMTGEKERATWSYRIRVVRADRHRREPCGAVAGARARRLDEPADAPRPRVFRIHVIEEGTGRGVPLVELKTVNQIRYVTDSNGIVAFDEPGLFNRKVFFTITSHGYEVEKDGFGYRGKALEVTEGGSADIVIRRLNIARRLYRVTGAGIYRDSVLTGDAVPIREPLLNGKVFGPGQRGERGLPGEDPLVLGRHQPSRLSARQFSCAGRHLRAARAMAGWNRKSAST